MHTSKYSVIYKSFPYNFVPHESDFLYPIVPHFRDKRQYFTILYDTLVFYGNMPQIPPISLKLRCPNHVIRRCLIDIVGLPRYLNVSSKNAYFTAFSKIFFSSFFMIPHFYPTELNGITRFCISICLLYLCSVTESPDSNTSSNIFSSFSISSCFLSLNTWVYKSIVICNVA